MNELSIDQALAQVSQRLHLSKEAETELLAEIRTHLEDAVERSREQGEDEQAALRNALANFGVEEVGEELQEVHSGRESIEAIVGTALPILFAITLRWLVFAPEGTSIAWHQLFTRPVFWLIAAAALIVPVLLFRRWRFALVGWGIFWLITVIFASTPNISQW
jgi:hypothetical protein